MRNIDQEPRKDRTFSAAFPNAEVKEICAKSTEVERMNRRKWNKANEGKRCLRAGSVPLFTQCQKDSKLAELFLS